MEPKIIGRKKELDVLQEIYESSEPQFLALYGRRRIGKTYMIHEFFKNKGHYFEITGMKEASLAEQLFQFAYEFARQFNDGEKIPTPKSWGEAFNKLHEAIEKKNSQKKMILFFDEVPWLASPKSNFLNALEHLWNRYLSRNNQIILIICGSSASWIIRNIINNRGGLYGRVTRKMRLLPFSLKETEEYFQSRNIDLDRKQVIDIYMALGGVPKYLSYVSKGKSAVQAINEICFSANGGLYLEFENLYKSLFEHYENHMAIVKALANTSNGLTKEEILEKTKLTSGGFSSRIIDDLVNAGFIIYVSSYNKKKIGGIYRLIDEYTLFYLTWIAEGIQVNLDNIASDFWIKLHLTPKWNVWSGSAFESLCFKHVHNIKKALGISGISSTDSTWRHHPKPFTEESGAQIDLVIDRADKCINLCEMKFCDAEYVINKQYAENLQNKKRVFREKTETKKTLFTTMITTYGVKKNSYCLSVVDHQLTMDDLFS